MCLNRRFELSTPASKLAGDPIRGEAAFMNGVPDVSGWFCVWVIRSITQRCYIGVAHSLLTWIDAECSRVHEGE